MTPANFLNQLHYISQKGIEKATMAQTSSNNSKVKSLAVQQQRDFERLDQTVLELVKERSFTLVEPGVTMRAEDTNTGDSRSPGKTSTMDRMSPDSPTTQMGTANETRTEASVQVGTPANALEGSIAENSGVDTKAARMERLRTLKGTAFDAEYLSMMIEGAQKHISMIENAGVKGDAKLNRVFDLAMKTFRDHQRRAELLQRAPSAS